MSAPVHHELVCGFLRWETRIAAMEPHLERACVFMPTRGTPRSKREALSSKAANERRAMAQEFVGHLLSTHRAWSREDAEAACAYFFDTYCDQGLWGLYAAVQDSLGLDLRIEAGDISVQVANAFDWIHTLDHIDSDSIIASAFAQTMSTEDDALELADWGVSAPLHAADLDKLLAPGVADMHVHIGGVRSASTLWHGVSLGLLSLDKLRPYGPRTITETVDADHRLALQRERDRIALAMTESLALLTTLRQARPQRVDLIARDARAIRVLLREERRQERFMLARAFFRLRPAVTQTADTAALEAQLDLYLHAKARFLNTMQQPVGTNPGLATFRSYFRNVRPLWGEGRPAPSRFGFSRRLQERALAEYGVHLEQSRKHLKRVELRMRPLDTARAYAQFLSSWEMVERAFDIDGDQVRFGIHFKRSSEGAKRHRDERADHVTLARHADREAWALQVFRQTPAYSERAKKIARLDIAGQERDGSPLGVAFAIKCLRGDPQALAELHDADADPIIHRHWLLLRDRGRSGAVAAKLGLSCHAGEDFFHPVEGLFSMDMAQRMLRLERGDSIGHGLAAGWSMRDWERLGRGRRYATRGAIFDALLWLEQSTPELNCTQQKALAQFLDQEFADFHGHARPDLSGLFERRAGPVLNRNRRPTDLLALIHWRECWHEGATAKRARKAPTPDKLLSLLAPAIERAQERLLTAIANAGVVLELNPSSNLRVAGLAHIDETPFANLLARNDLTISVNTDDPGTFGTRIENELAIALTTLLDKLGEDQAAMRKMEQVRNAGLHDIRWP